MRIFLLVLSVVALHQRVVNAQSQSTTEKTQATDAKQPESSLQQPVPQQSPSQSLPDNPIPVQPSPQDGPAPCPYGEGKSCALLGGRLYFSDPGHMTEHDATWRKSMRNPMLIVGGLVNMASTVAEIEGNQACIRAQTCTGGNPLFGSRPSRARAYGISVPVGFAFYAVAARLKQKGYGNFAFGLLCVGTAANVYSAANEFTQARK